MKVKVTGTNLRGKEITVILDVIKTKKETGTHMIVKWTDGKSAAYSSKIWRSTTRRFTTLLKDITFEEIINKENNMETGTIDCEIVESAYNLKGQECSIKVGDKVRAWDFEPMTGREDAYVEGIFTGYTNDGRLIISEIFTDTLYDGKGKRTEIFTPPFGQVIFGEWNGRITKLDNVVQNIAI